jgi:outer membrane protein, multidrug efflux system
MRRTTQASLLLAAAALTACIPQAPLTAPPPLRSSAWSSGEAAGTAAPQTLGAALGSAELATLVERALAANPDLGAAAARIQRARAQLRGARAQALPTVDGRLGLQGVRSDDSGNSAFDFSAGSALLDISWEVDLFGRLAAGRRAAAARVIAARFDRDAVALALEAELARAFVQHSALAARIALLDRNLASARELERIIGVRLRLGAATRVDLGLQAVEVRQLEVERTRIVEALRRTRNAMAALAGDEAPLFTAPLADLAELSPPTLAPVQPAELLVRRPDLRAAEARIAAASGDVESARRAFLPQLRLSAGALGQAASLSGPLGATLSIGADLLAPIFNRGRLHGALGEASATQRESVELYRAALLQALREAEDALAGAAQSRERALLLDRIVGDARETARLARLQYVEGYADLQRVIEAESRLIAIEDARVLAVQERLEAAIDLYRAMGGPPAREAPRLAGRRRTRP